MTGIYRNLYTPLSRNVSPIRSLLSLPTMCTFPCLRASPITYYSTTAYSRCRIPSLSSVHRNTSIPLQGNSFNHRNITNTVTTSPLFPRALSTRIYLPNMQRSNYSSSKSSLSSSSSPPPSPSPSSSSTTSSSTIPSTAPMPNWVTMLNEAITTYPAETMAAFIAMDIGTIGAMYTLLDLSHISIPADFALAFGISRLLRRIRMPIDVSFAAILTKIFPSLAMVQPSKAFGNPQSIIQVPNPNIFRRGGYAFIKLIDKYGLAFLISQRMFVGLASVFTIFMAIRTGIDIQSLLSTYGFEFTQAGKIAGTWAAAACLAAFVFPLVLITAGFLGIRIGKLRKLRQLSK